MNESGGKGARVTGFFVFQIGAGIILDSGAHALGALVALGGAALLAWGLLRVGRRDGAAVDGGTASGSTSP